MGQSFLSPHPEKMIRGLQSVTFPPYPGAAGPVLAWGSGVPDPASGLLFKGSSCGIGFTRGGECGTFLSFHAPGITVFLVRLNFYRLYIGSFGKIWGHVITVFPGDWNTSRTVRQLSGWSTEMSDIGPSSMCAGAVLCCCSIHKYT